MRRLVDLRGAVVGWQRWHEILFAHRRVAPEALRALVDDRLELDLFDGAAWASLTPFTVRGARLRGLPHVPRLTTFHELNLRTYVRSAAGEPGVWFFSLDAASAPAAALARAGLPYRFARMSRSASGVEHDYRSERLALGPRPASFSARWTVGDLRPDPPGSLEHFLVERYALYTTVLGRLVRVRVRHAPWVLREARVDHLAETVTGAAGIRAAPELLAQFSEGVDVEFLPPELVG